MVEANCRTIITHFGDSQCSCAQPVSESIQGVTGTLSDLGRLR